MKSGGKTENLAAGGAGGSKREEGERERTILNTNKRKDEKIA